MSPVLVSNCVAVLQSATMQLTSLPRGCELQQQQQQLSLLVSKLIHHHDYTTNAEPGRGALDDEGRQTISTIFWGWLL